MSHWIYLIVNFFNHFCQKLMLNVKIIFGWWIDHWICSSVYALKQNAINCAPNFDTAVESSSKFNYMKVSWEREAFQSDRSYWIPHNPLRT